MCDLNRKYQFVATCMHSGSKPAFIYSKFNEAPSIRYFDPKTWSAQPFNEIHWMSGSIKAGLRGLLSV